MSTPTPNVLESRLEADLYRRVRGVLGGIILKLAPTARGIPDRLVVLPGGRVYLVELKTNLGRLSPTQQFWHAKFAKVGLPVHVIYGADQLREWVRARVNERADAEQRESNRVPARPTPDLIDAMRAVEHARESIDADALPETYAMAALTALRP